MIHNNSYQCAVCQQWVLCGSAHTCQWNIGPAYQAPPAPQHYHYHTAPFTLEDIRRVVNEAVSQELAAIIKLMEKRSTDSGI